MLQRVPGLLSESELTQARALLREAAWVDGRQTAGPQAAAVKNNHQLQADSPEAKSLQVLLLGALNRSPLFFSAALPKRVLPPQFNRYGDDANRYGPHVDQAIRFHSGGGQGTRADLSCTVFLSEPEEYEGGDLVIGEGDFAPRAKLPAGDALLYPATSVHEVRPVTRGIRWASFFWVESMVRSDDQRRLLHVMDMALLRLRERHGESQEAVQLTGVYHNLLRLWADT